MGINTFSRFIKRELSRSFKKVHYVSANIDSQLNKDVRVLFIKYLILFLYNNWVVCFTDSTIVASSSVKPYAWGYKKERVYHPQKSKTKRRHFLVSMTQYGVETCMVSSKSAQVSQVGDFYYDLCLHLKRM